jgi:hypothetical protein
MRRTLAESSNFVVTHEFELAFATEKGTGREIPLGSHYGDPTCAVIAPDESWLAVGGEGVTGFHRRLGEFTCFRDDSAVHDVRIRYDDPSSGEQRTVDGVQREDAVPIFIRKLAVNDAGQLEAVVDDDEETTVVVDIPR